MSSLGAHLRELRERRGVSLDEISRTTRVGRSYLEALEAGDLARLPAPVFTRGFIRAYCQVLGEPPDDALRHFGEHARDTADDTAQPYDRHARTPSRTRGSVMVSFVLLVVLGAALLAVTFTLRSGRDASQRPAATQAEPRTPQADGPASSPAVVATTPAVTSAEPTPATSPGVPPPTDAGPPTALQPGPSVSSAPASTTPVHRADPPTIAGPAERTGSTMAPTPRSQERPATVAALAPPVTTIAPAAAREAERSVASATAPYRLIARTVESTWVRVRTEDGRHLSEETIPAGQVREWVSNRRFTVLVGNAAGVKLELNGVTLPALGPSRAVVELSLPPQAQ